jgi:hypothetical protein
MPPADVSSEANHDHDEKNGSRDRDPTAIVSRKSEIETVIDLTVDRIASELRVEVEHKQMITERRIKDAYRSDEFTNTSFHDQPLPLTKCLKCIFHAGCYF